MTRPRVAPYLALAALLSGAVLGCSAPALDPRAVAAFIEPTAVADRPTASELPLLAIGLQACPRPTTPLDSSTTFDLGGTPRLAVRLPAGFVRSSARQPTPTLVRFVGPEGAVVIVERAPDRIATLGPAYADITVTTRPVCAFATPHGTVPAQFMRFAPASAPIFDPTSDAGAVVNVPNLRVEGELVSVAVYARTVPERTALATLATRLRVVP
jgi:hypothetical protein